MTCVAGRGPPKPQRGRCDSPGETHAPHTPAPHTSHTHHTPHMPYSPHTPQRSSHHGTVATLVSTGARDAVTAFCTLPVSHHCRPPCHPTHCLPCDETYNYYLCHNPLPSLSCDSDDLLASHPCHPPCRPLALTQALTGNRQPWRHLLPSVRHCESPTPSHPSHPSYTHTNTPLTPTDHHTLTPCYSIWCMVVVYSGIWPAGGSSVSLTITNSSLKPHTLTWVSPYPHGKGSPS